MVAGFLGAYRILLSDLVVLTMAEEPLATRGSIAALRAAIGDVRADIPVIAAVLRPRPVEPVAGRRIAFFSTAPTVIHDRLRAHLEQEHGARVSFVSGSLARREQLRAELDSAAVRAAELYLVEIKAAAIDVVAEAAQTREIPVVFVDNAVRPLDRGALPGRVLLALAEAAMAEEVAA